MSLIIHLIYLSNNCKKERENENVHTLSNVLGSLFYGSCLHDALITNRVRYCCSLAAAYHQHYICENDIFNNYYIYICVINITNMCVRIVRFLII